MIVTGIILFLLGVILLVMAQLLHLPAAAIHIGWILVVDGILIAALTYGVT